MLKTNENARRFRIKLFPQNLTFYKLENLLNELIKTVNKYISFLQRHFYCSSKSWKFNMAANTFKNTLPLHYTL